MLHLIKYVHLYQALVVSPQCTLFLPFSHASCHLVSLEMPPTSNMIKGLSLFLYNFAIFPKVLYSEFTGAVDWRSDYYGTALETNCDAWLHLTRIDTATKNCLGSKVGRGERDRKRGVSVNMRQRRFKHRTANARGTGEIVARMFIQSNYSLTAHIRANTSESVCNIKNIPRQEDKGLCVVHMLT
jgi:hypothetical protein